jgi:hypothetical protein
VSLLLGFLPTVILRYRSGSSLISSRNVEMSKYAGGASEAGESLRVDVEVLDDHIGKLFGEGTTSHGSAEDVLPHCSRVFRSKIESAVYLEVYRERLAEIM